MILRVTENEHDNDYTVVVEDVPFDYSNADVKWNVQQWAKSGDRTARRALELVGDHWISLNGSQDDYRVYVDGELPRKGRR